MPELPEVETTARGIRPSSLGRPIDRVVIRNASLRWPVPLHLTDILPGHAFTGLSRRGKYLLFQHPRGTLIIHLGMSGHLRVIPATKAAEKHDHIDIVMGIHCLRFNDPRRFGAMLWTESDPLQHPLLATLGPEPLEDGFDADYLLGRLRKKQIAIKLAIMDSHLVVGVGNIYANESLFLAGIHPQKPACDLTHPECTKLVDAIRRTLAAAIEAGGSSLRDYVQADGNKGWFQQQYRTYGRQDQPCHQCGDLIRLSRMGGRATYWCPHCQPFVAN